MALVKQEHFGIARKIVANMTLESWTDIPHFSLVHELDATDFLEELKKLNEGVTDKTKRITLNTAMLKVICEGIKVCPAINTHLEFDRKLVRGTLKYFDNIDISMPMMFPNGEMMTVNMHDMGNKTLSEMTAAIQDTVRRAANTDMNEVMFEVSMDNTLKGLKKGKLLQAIRRLFGSKMPGKHRVKTLSGKAKKDYYAFPETDRLTLHDIEQGTITVSNFGSAFRDERGACCMLEVIPPQTTVLAICAVQEKPWVVTKPDGSKSIEIRKILPLTIAVDHKALDLGDVVPFFNRVDEIFKDPTVIQNWK